MTQICRFCKEQAATTTIDGKPACLRCYAEEAYARYVQGEPLASVDHARLLEWEHMRILGSAPLVKARRPKPHDQGVKAAQQALTPILCACGCTGSFIPRDTRQKFIPSHRKYRSHRCLECGAMHREGHGTTTQT